MNPTNIAKRRSKRVHAQNNEAEKCHDSGKVPTLATKGNEKCMNLPETTSRMSNHSSALVMKRTGPDEKKHFDGAAIGPRAKRKSGV